MSVWLQVPCEAQLLKKEVDGKQWDDLDESTSLSDCGFSTTNAKAQQPAVVALCLKTEGTHSQPSPDPVPNPNPDPGRFVPGNPLSAPLSETCHDAAKCLSTFDMVEL